MNIEFDGEAIQAEIDFHYALAEALDLPDYYGKNLNALWDILSTDVERPLRLEWKNSVISKDAMGERFDLIVGVLRRVERQDREWNLADRFELILS
jgi:ribonuclease inhibitor